MHKDSVFSCSYRRSGSGEVVVLIHGALADERMWAAHSDLLDHDFDVIALTQRHFGVNGTTDGGAFGLNTHAEDVIQFVQGLPSRQPVHLVGWSYGADVVLNALVKQPRLCASALLFELGYAGYLTEAEMGVFGADAKAMFGPIFSLAAVGKLAEALRTLIDGSGQQVGYFEGQTPAAQKQQLENLHSLPKQLNQQEVPNLTMDTLPKITVPVTVAYGQETRPLFRVVSQAAVRLIPTARGVCVPEATHMLPIERPDLFVKLIEEHVVGIQGE
ncbi:MAG: alpha/beta hydrolase [Anaerolineales bacterium]|nr:alpha/beta hydrolase [Anaerolineales bacterium]